jgi:hypothetical protein
VNQSHETQLSQWNDSFPPLNLWNYNLYWQWCQEWEIAEEHRLTTDTKDC